jgi:hypothetical protein
MKSNAAEYSVQELLVNSAIKRVLEPYSSKLTVTVGTLQGGATWMITPINPNSASMYVYGIDEVTVNISVDEMYWLEFFVNKNKWHDFMPLLERYLIAVAEGRIAGWHQKPYGDDRDIGIGTVLEIDIGDRQPVRWSSNVLFAKLFKSRRSIIHKQFAKY